MEITTMTRAGIVGAILAGAALAFSGGSSSGGHAPVKPSGPTTDQGLSLLMDGNKRWTEGVTANLHRSTSRREEVAKGQKPFAVVVTCSDSRLTPEFIFDQGLGDLFVVRVAGNTLNQVNLGSIEYAVEHLGSNLIVVMGHERCGAVDAALGTGHLPGNLPAVVEPIEGAAKTAHAHPKDQQLEVAVIENVKNMAATLTKKSEIIAKFVKEGKVKIVGMRYDLDSGQASLVTPSRIISH